MAHDVSFHGQMSDSFRAAIFIILSGGFQDAYTYCCRGGVFANAQTGNIVLLSTALFQREWPTALKYLIPILSFMIGIAAAEVVHIRLKHYEKIHWRQIILLCEILLLLAVGFMPQRLDALANALVSFVCALQVQCSGCGVRRPGDLGLLRVAVGQLRHDVRARKVRGSDAYGEKETEPLSGGLAGLDRADAGRRAGGGRRR